MRRIASVLCIALLLSALPAQATAAQLLGSFSVGVRPFGVVAGPNGSMYVANSGTQLPDGSGRISVVAPASGSVTSLATTKAANLLAVDASARRLYSSNADVNTSAGSFDVFDLDAGTRVMTLPLGGLGVALDASRSRAYVAGGRDLTAVDTSSFATTSVSAPTTASWFGVGVDAGLGRVFVTNINNSSPSLAILDADTLAVLADVALPSVPRFALAVDADRHLVYVAGSDPTGPPYTGSTLSLVDGTNGAILRTIGFPGFPSGIARSASTHQLYVTDSYRNSVAAFDDTSLAIVTAAVALPWQPSLAALGADGRLYVSGYSANVLGVVDISANSIPVVDAVQLTPSEPRTNDTLTTLVTAHDPDGDALTYAYRWYRNGVALATAGPTLDLSVSSSGDKGDRIEVDVVVSDGKAESTPSTGSSWTVTVVNSPPTASVSLSTTTPTKRTVIIASVNASDADTDALMFTYTWRVKGVVRQVTATNSTTNSLDLRMLQVENSDLIRVDVVASDGSASVNAFATAVVTKAH